MWCTLTLPNKFMRDLSKGVKMPLKCTKKKTQQMALAGLKKRKTNNDLNETPSQSASERKLSMGNRGGGGGFK